MTTASGVLTAGLYLSSGIQNQVTQAQHELDAHIASGPDGRCLNCGQDEPCSRRQEAVRAFARYGQLPRRRPGLARVRPSGNRTGGLGRR